MFGRGDLLILDISLLWQTVSNAADKSTATQTVRPGGLLWLNPIAMSVVNCNRAEVVECSCLKPGWSCACWRYLLIVGRIRVSRTFAAGQRSEIGRYENHWEVYLPGFGIGMINVINWVSLEEECLPSFEVLNCLLNLVAS